MSIINQMKLAKPFKNLSPKILVLLLISVGSGILLMLGSIAGVGILGAFHHIASTYHGQAVESAVSSVPVALENLLKKAVDNEQKIWSQQSLRPANLKNAKYEMTAWHWDFTKRQLNIVSAQNRSMMLLADAGLPFQQLVENESGAVPAYPGYVLPKLPADVHWNISRVAGGKKSAWLVWAMSDDAESGIWGFRIMQKEVRPDLIKLLRRHCHDNYMKIALVDAQKQLLLAVNHEGELKNTTALTAGENQIFIERPLAGVLDGLHLQIVYTPFIFGEIPNWGYQLILILIGLTGALLVGSIVYFYGRDRVASHQLQLQNDWVLNLAHALRGPCHALGVLTEAMKANSETDNDELFVLAQRELETMDNHCRQFLQLARQEKKAVDRKLEPLELQPLLRQAISRVLLRYPQLDKKAVTLQDIPPVKVRGNYEAAGESFITVIDNALKYSLHKKEVAVNAVANDSQVCLEIADQGLGIAPDELPQIGQAFYRSDRPDFEGINGTGVGLYLAFAASEAMGWQMQIESDGVGKGSKVIFTIPVVKK